MKGISPDMLKGKVAWVTASSRGIGRAIAKRLACCGSSIAVHSRSDTTASEFGEAPSTNYVTEEIGEIGVPVTTIFADLSNLSEVRKAAERIEKKLGPIDILVNNAGGDIGSSGRPNPNDAIYISERDMSAVIARNLLSTIFCCQIVVPEMIKRKNGRIINIGSVDAFLVKGVLYQAFHRHHDGLVHTVGKDGSLDFSTASAFRFFIRHGSLLLLLCIGLLLIGPAGSGLPFVGGNLSRSGLPFLENGQDSCDILAVPAVVPGIEVVTGNGLDPVLKDGTPFLLEHFGQAFGGFLAKFLGFHAAKSSEYRVGTQ